MIIDDRKLKILQAIIHNYITNAEPVGSRTISKKYDLGVSSATIRNEMSDLEDLGFLVQPHTSAGRIPSDKAYRLYVDSLMKVKTGQLKYKDRIKDILLEEVGEIEQVIQNSSKILSQITKYTSLAIAPRIKQSRLKHIQLVPIDDNKILVVIITDSGVVKNTMFRVDEYISTDHLTIITNLLNAKLEGHIIGQIGKELEESLVKEIYNYKNTLRNVIPLFNQCINELEEIELFSEGLTNIFDFPEYKDVSKAKAFISFMENKQFVVDMLMRGYSGDIDVTIGSENSHKELENCSIITATYNLDGKTIGKIGVIGPTRMDYSMVIPVVKVVALNLNDILTKYFI
ncbi:heat-inducible transcriptional repressor HrcA [Clostridiisalibacter paucivorans]|uniref:heat-inducible transcriptional repressor HrcA n=1 Tax=Clostridiisalibacter paucivorans TaxID=408753 RepID=UPI00047E2C5E|nr:heat-inducible transcriptional repressor HrcA [Clostridiisalibacter paucivorans]